MVKIFIGNLPYDAEEEEIEALFSPYGLVTECVKSKDKAYAFVHIEDWKAATKAIRELNKHKMHGRPLAVMHSKGKNQFPVKLHISNVEMGFCAQLRTLFEEYGKVTECTAIKNFAFVHMANSDEAIDAIKGLDNHELGGKCIHVQISKRREMTRGMAEEDQQEEEEDYYYHPPPPPPWGRRGHFPPPGRAGHFPPPGRGGHFPPPYPGQRPEPPYRGCMLGYPQLPPRRPAYPEHCYDEHDDCGVVDYYEKYSAGPYTAEDYDDIPLVWERPYYAPDGSPIQWAPPPPAHMAANDYLYERRPLPPPSAYYARDRSPIRRAPPPPVHAAGNGYPYERSRLSLVPRAPMYGAPRPRDPYADRAPPPPMRYPY